MEQWQIALLVSLLTWLLNQPWLPQPVFVFLLICLISLVLDLIAENGDVKRALSRGLEPKWDTAPVAAATTLAIFDFIYALPLLFTKRGRTYQRMIRRAHWTPLKSWWWAFWPSTLITVVATFFLTYRYFPRAAGNAAAFWSGIAVNIVSDYLALFVIRSALVTGQASLPRALFLAPLAGMLAGILLVISFTGVRLVLFLTISLYPFDAHALCNTIDPGFCVGVSADDRSFSYLDNWNVNAVKRMLLTLVEIHFPGVLAACLVHVWLPVFAVLTIMLKLINIPLYAVNGFVRGVRWWVGKDHPVLALGAFAGLVIMVVLLLQDPPPWLLDLLRRLTYLPSLLT
jgi:hypothetical protein